MNANKQKNLVMTAVAAAVIVAVNVGVWLAASKGAIAPIDNVVLWAGFVALNVVSILWAISLLGLQPLVVSLSYAVGGFLAFKGVRGMEGINVAEVATAGATYGAFGALAIGNSTAKVRLAFFNKGQVPFISIIVGLLVIDAMLNSGISNAGGSVLLNAVVFPFVLAGIVIGLIWSVLNRFGIGRKPNEVIAEAEVAAMEAEGNVVDAVATEKLVIQMPEHAAVAEEAEPAIATEEIKTPDPIEVPVAEPLVAESAQPVTEKKPDENFFPLEIDKDDEYDIPVADTGLMNAVAMMDDAGDEGESFSVPSFDASLYASGSLDGGVMVEEPPVSVALDLDVETDVKPEPVQEVKQEQKNDDWLGGHLDLLNKLK
ncbi:MAG: hypothetical protein U9P12_05520 [Verrucomicrobiota bacterium]|nr:hypothetical protein [Verrucomicrobiota bacterium]